MASEQTVKLRVPKQDLDRTRFFSSEPAAVSEWLENLPMANLGQATRQLYQALLELNRCRMMPDKRLELLEQLRRPIYFVVNALSKHYLNKPVALPSQPQQVAELVQSLHQHLASGYTIVAAHTAALGKQAIADPPALIAKALHRSFAEYGKNLQLLLELYETPSESYWQTLFQFYLLARQYDLLQMSINDPELGRCTIEQAYLRILLLCCSRPNQLRQEDIRQLCALLTNWSSYCHLGPADEHCVYVLNRAGSHSPVYRELFNTLIDDQWLGIDCRALCAHLQKLLAGSDGKKPLVTIDGEQVNRYLLSHLLSAWSRSSRRSSMRIEDHGQLEICIGLSATHHFISDEIDFEAFVQQQGARTLTMDTDNPFLKTRAREVRQKDVWDSPYENNLGKLDVALEAIEFQSPRNQNSPEKAAKYRSHQVEIVNSSAQGYCVQWPEQNPTLFRAGEVVGVRELNSHNWHVGVIRWVGKGSKSDEEASAGHSSRIHLGLQLLSPSAAPYAAQVLHKTGDPSEYMRVLALPAMPTLNQPVTLLTPRVPFQPDQKIQLNQRGKLAQVRLGERLNDFGNYTQFAFTRVSGVMGRQQPTDGDDEFASLWGNL